MYLQVSSEQVIGFSLMCCMIITFFRLEIEIHSSKLRQKAINRGKRILISLTGSYRKISYESKERFFSRKDSSQKKFKGHGVWGAFEMFIKFIS